MKALLSVMVPPPVCRTTGPVGPVRLTAPSVEIVPEWRISPIVSVPVVEIVLSAAFESPRPVEPAPRLMAWPGVVEVRFTAPLPAVIVPPSAIPSAVRATDAAAPPFVTVPLTVRVCPAVRAIWTGLAPTLTVPETFTAVESCRYSAPESVEVPTTGTLTARGVAGAPTWPVVWKVRVPVPVRVMSFVAVPA